MQFNPSGFFALLIILSAVASTFGGIVLF